MTEFKIPKKLIEVALPLDKINEAAAREKSIRHGHPSTLHLWWARRPLAAARAVIFAQMVNDPGYERHLGRGVNKKEAEKERKRLFALIEKLVLWENTDNEEVLSEARAEIWKSWQETCRLNRDHPKASELFNPSVLPAFHDPFAGGGALPLEAQRLGLESYASDLNPVAVLINKAMIEIPPRFAGKPPVNPDARENKMLFRREWQGAQGLAEDVRYYGKWMRDEAENRIGHHYPKVEVTAAMAAERPDLKPFVGQQVTVIAWLWARTVKSPNPAFAHVDVPLTSTFMLSTKAGKEAYVEPVILENSYRFTVKLGKPPESAKNGTKLARGANFRCLMSGTPIASDYIKAEGKAGRMGAKLLAAVAEGERGRIYLDPTDVMEAAAHEAQPIWQPETPLAPDPRALWTPPYGLTTFGNLFTARQLVALTTFSDLVQEARDKAMRDALAAGLPDDAVGIGSNGTGATAYADAVSVYLAFAQSKACNRNTSLCLWEHRMDRIVATFGRQALPMVWDFAETNPLAGAGGDLYGTVVSVCEVIDKQFNSSIPGKVQQESAITQGISQGKLISTDPPYYDNIGYADLSDFFYVWLRRSLKQIFPDLFATMAVPKAEELVALQYRHGSKENAEEFFLTGMTQAMHRLAEQAHPALPVTIYYAFKQSESKSETGTYNTGWETFLEAVIAAGFAVCGTWPMRTEQPKGLRAFEQNALASSIILVCRQRSPVAATVSRKDFIRELRVVLPEALDEMTLGSRDAAPIAPVDLAQAAIGPGMAIYSKYSAILDGSGAPLSVRAALALINKEIDAYFNQGEGEMDADTRFCLDWFSQYGWKTGEFGTADTLARAKGTSVEGIRNAGVAEAAGGKVRLLRPAEYLEGWDPTEDDRLPLWEGLHQLIRVFNAGGERETAKLLRLLGTRQDALRQLAYRLYTECERKGWAEDARAYNDLVVAWEHIERALENLREESPIGQMALF